MLFITFLFNFREKYSRRLAVKRVLILETGAIDRMAQGKQIWFQGLCLVGDWVLMGWERRAVTEDDENRPWKAIHIATNPKHFYSQNLWYCTFTLQSPSVCNIFYLPCLVIDNPFFIYDWFLRLGTKIQKRIFMVIYVLDMLKMQKWCVGKRHQLWTQFKVRNREKV